MVVVAPQEFRPFVDKGGEAPALVIIAGIRRLAPDKISELVGPIEEALFEYLLVQARAVEPAGHGALDVAPQFVVRGRRPDSVGVESLVEDQALENRLVVDEDAASVDRHLAQTKVAIHHVERFPPLESVSLRS
jgi:hypothetical protein